MTNFEHKFSYPGDETPHHKISDMISFAKYRYPSLRRLRGGMDRTTRRPVFEGLGESADAGKRPPCPIEKI
jgi:hypothetical protein